VGRVWLVWYGDGPDGFENSLKCIFSTEEKACHFMDTKNRNGIAITAHYWYNEWEVE
jgi:hypothetical protein